MARQLITPPTIKPVRFGLFSVADVRDVNDAGWTGVGIQTENPAGCGNVGVAVQPCDDPVTKDERLVPEYPEGDPFTAYAIVECSGPVTFNEGRDTATQALALNEERQVESAFMTQLLTDADDHTPTSGVLEAAHGIALLEGLWGQYGGAMEPTFHLDRTVAHLGWGGIDRHGNHLETELGSQVAAGAGYFDPAYDETDGTSWIVVTGPVVVQRGVARAHDPVFVQDPLDNVWIAMAERSYSWLYFCQALKVQVNSISDLGSL